MKAAIEPHYRVSELAELWKLSAGAIRSLFAAEPGVLKLSGPSGRYVTLSIPESVALRVHARLSEQPLKAARSSRQPRSVVLLRDRDARVSQKTRHIIKLKAVKKPTNSERIA